MVAGVLELAPSAEPVNWFSGALSQDAQPRDGEVIDDRIFRVQKPQGGGDLIGHSPIGRPPVREAEEIPDSGDVGIHGNEELAGKRNGPEAQIHPVRRPDDPFQKQMEPFARARPGWVGKKKLEGISLAFFLGRGGV
jgi:hypothetical protein